MIDFDIAEIYALRFENMVNAAFLLTFHLQFVPFFPVLCFVPTSNSNVRQKGMLKSNPFAGSI